MQIELILNGTRKRTDVKPNELVLNMLRERLHLTGTKYGCGIGECGACTILVNGEPVLSCLMLAPEVDGKEVVTVEGLANDGELDSAQEAFLEVGAVQCGFCTPGFIMTAKALVNKNPDPTEEDVRNYLKGNLCRCTGYINIVRAIRRAAKKMSMPIHSHVIQR